MKRLLFAALAALAIFGITAPQQGHAQGIRAAIVFQNFDLDSVGTFVFCDTANPISPSLGSVCTTGTDADDGWMRVPPGRKEINVNIDDCSLSIGTASCRLTVQGRYEIQGSTRTVPLFVTNTTIAPIDFFDSASPQDGLVITIVEEVDQIRIGLSIEGGTDDADTPPEDITVVLDFFS